MPLLSKPGEQFYYNATNYLLLQKIIEKYGHLPFEQYIQQHQLNVVGMQRATFANSFDVIKDKAPTYTYYYQDNIYLFSMPANKVLLSTLLVAFCFPFL